MPLYPDIFKGMGSHRTKIPVTVNAATIRYTSIRRIHSNIDLANAIGI